MYHPKWGVKYWEGGLQFWGRKSGAIISSMQGAASLSPRAPSMQAIRGFKRSTPRGLGKD